jgi:hypothetical protein
MWRCASSNARSWTGRQGNPEQQLSKLIGTGARLGSGLVNLDVQGNFGAVVELHPGHARMLCGVAFPGIDVHRLGNPFGRLGDKGQWRGT